MSAITARFTSLADFLAELGDHPDLGSPPIQKIHRIRCAQVYFTVCSCACDEPLRGLVEPRGGNNSAAGFERGWPEFADWWSKFRKWFAGLPADVRARIGAKLIPV